MFFSASKKAMADAHMYTCRHRNLLRKGPIVLFKLVKVHYSPKTLFHKKLCSVW